MNIEIGNLGRRYSDILREIGSIGAGNAATSLSKLLNRRIDMDVPRVVIVRFQEIEKLIGDVENPVVGIYLEFEGDIGGTLMFVLDEDSAKNLLSLLIKGMRPNTVKGFSELEISAFKEIGNIMAGAFLGAISAFTGLKMRPCIPDFAYDMAGAILSVPMIEYSKMGEVALFIETEFIEGPDSIKSQLFVIPNVESYPIILKSLGVTK